MKCSCLKILPKTRKVYAENGGDVKIVLSVLACVSKILNMLDKASAVLEGHSNSRIGH